MALPIAATLPPTAQYLYCRCQLDWARHLADETTLDAGIALTSPTFATLHDANRVMDAAVPAGTTAEDVIDAVDGHFAARGVRCRRWTLNPSIDAARQPPLIDALLARGYRAWTLRLMRLERAEALPNNLPSEDVAVLPARAAYPAARRLAAESAAEAGVPQLAEAFEAHLDDSHYDVLLALDTVSRHAIGRAGLLTVGDVGLITQTFVSAAERRRGVARLLLTRLLELASRAGLRHVVLGLDPANTAAHALYARAGLVDAGLITQYLRD